VLDARHVVVLEDWLSFVTLPPADMAVYVHDDEEAVLRVDAAARARGVRWTPVVARPGEDLANGESVILQRLADATSGKYVMTVNLDTLPFRAGAAEERWLEEAFDLLENQGFAHLTGDGIMFREDRAHRSGRFFETKCFSNNFGLIERAFWQAALDRHPPGSKGHEGRKFHSEWAVNEEVRRLGRWGLRRVHTPSWRVFHVQQWDDRLFETRALFRRGVGIKPFLNCVWEDKRHVWQRHFNYPKPPLARRLRVRLGELRRGIW
jgi:hypothetical protein